MLKTALDWVANLRFQIKAIRKAGRMRRRYSRDRLWIEAKRSFSRNLDSGRLDEAKRQIAKIESTALAPMIPALQERLDAELLVQRQQIPSERRVKMWWSDRPYPGNIGDSFNPWLIEKLSGAPVIRRRPEEGGMLAAGSIAGLATAGCHVWGSGFISRNVRPASGVTWHAVRGPISRNMIIDSGGECPPIHGDPALLVPRFLPPSQKRGGRIGIVLHYSHREFLRPGDAKIISTEGCGEADLRKFISDLLDCDFIFSSSLHGLIFANAYDIPSRRCIFSRHKTGIGGDDMKFPDYWLGVGLPEHDALDLDSLHDFDERSLALHRIGQSRVRFDGDAFLGAFPLPDLLT